MGRFQTLIFHTRLDRNLVNKVSCDIIPNLNFLQSKYLDQKRDNLPENFYIDFKLLLYICFC